MSLMQKSQLSIQVAHRIIQCLVPQDSKKTWKPLNRIVSSKELVNE